MHDPRSSTENFIEVKAAWRHRMWVNWASLVLPDLFVYANVANSRLQTVVKVHGSNTLILTLELTVGAQLESWRVICGSESHTSGGTSSEIMALEWPHFLQS